MGERDSDQDSRGGTEENLRKAAPTFLGTFEY